MLTSFNSLKQSAQALLSDNASAILTAGGVVGTVGTAVLTGRAAFKTGTRWSIEKSDDSSLEMGELSYTKKDLVRDVWPEFVPPVLLGGATVASIVMANRISAKRAAALAAAYGISERSFQEYREKMLERLGVKQEQKARDEIAQDRVNANPPSSEVVVVAGGEVLCFEMLTGRYFRSSMENIRRAENVINKELLDYQQVSLSRLFEELGLPATQYSEEVGWNTIGEGQVSLEVSTVLSPDDKPCLAISFNRLPNPDYDRPIHS